MPIILLTNHYSEGPLTILKEELPLGFEIISLDKACKEELIKKACKADYFLASGRLSIDRDVLDAAVNLKMIQRTGVGTDTLDLELLKEKGIPVYVNKGVNSRSVAEHTIMLILAVLRRLHIVNSNVKMGIWKKQEQGLQCFELNEKTVGLVGVGNIGIHVAKMLQPFGARILYYDLLRLDNIVERGLNMVYCSLEELLKEVDILSLHCPLNSKTQGMIGSQEIALMKRGAILINTSRGPLVDEEAMTNALKSGHLKGAGLDVFLKEPLSNDSPLLSLDNVILSPHIGGVTSDAFRRMMRDAFSNIKLFHEGKKDVIESKRLKVNNVL